MIIIIATLAGILFGLGLIVGGMTNPAKVLNFLDITGTWDPSLAFVMAGAIAVAFLAFKQAKQQTISWLGLPIHLPTATQIDVQLILGAALFGAGWGIAGFCPGPAIASILTGGEPVWVFVVSMLLGMAGYTVFSKK